MSEAGSTDRPTPPPFALGGVLDSVGALGTAPASNWDQAPTPGCDLIHRYPEDLRMFGELGVRSIRLAFDWSRLQPAPGRIDHDWREWYETFLTHAERLGIDVWATLLESTVPAWFDDEGSFADARAAGLAWPRWVETAAELFGDRVSGWFPIVDPVGVAHRWHNDTHKHQAAVISLSTAWRDAWRILRGGPPVSTALRVHMVRPVDASVPAAEAARLDDHLRWRWWMRSLRDGIVRFPDGSTREIPDLAASLDVLGITTSLDLPEAALTDDALRRWHERCGTVLRRAAEEGPQRPMTLAGLSVRWPHTDERRLIVETTVDSLHAAVNDGVPLRSVFVDPAIGASSDTAASLVDRDRATTSDGAPWLAVSRPPTPGGETDSH